MMQHTHIKQKALWVGFLLLCFVLWLRAFVWTQYHIPETPNLGTPQMVAGTAAKPFVTRMLVPVLAIAADKVLPDIAKDSLADVGAALQQWYGRIAQVRMKKTQVPADLLYWRSLTGVFIAAFLALYGIGLYRLGRYFFPDAALAAWFAVWLGYAMVPLGTWRAAFIYDAATLCLAVWCLYLLLQQRWRPFLGVFALACLNKETAFYSTLLYITCCYGQIPNKTFNRILALQCIIFVLVFAGKYAWFHAAGGGLAEYHFNQFFAGWTFMMPLQQGLAVLCGLFLFFYHWSEKPEALRKTVPVLLIAIAVWLVFGRRGEYRGLYEIYPIITLCYAHTLCVATGLHNSRLLRGL